MVVPGVTGVALCVPGVVPIWICTTELELWVCDSDVDVSITELEYHDAISRPNYISM